MARTLEYGTVVLGPGDTFEIGLPVVRDRRDWRPSRAEEPQGWVAVGSSKRAGIVFDRQTLQEVAARHGFALAKEPQDAAPAPLTTEE